uniref:Si:ch211-15d5.11 n=1 Tax=Paramormyrops kingsleyae TaxID=1676925 RepID=A0A3B3R5C8_9TELE|nr:nuclear receptor coactivator 7-like [Paramormyrops kingsleyae]XP_023690460.1 nuclear receptor coactivator 7-like [Paramormyrops kingsleyae]XP_023690461.1 nuclear receptor coactivator 7-like [Paramormyrops kingsleyae]
MDSFLNTSAPPSCPSTRTMDQGTPEKARTSYFSNVKTRLGSSLPTDTPPVDLIVSPPGPPRATGRALARPQQPQVRHHVPHIRNPQLRQYYLREASWDSDTANTALAASGDPAERKAEDSTGSRAPETEAPPTAAADGTPPTPTAPTMSAAGLPSPLLDADYDKLLDVEAVSMPDGRLCLLALPPECSVGGGSATAPYLKLCCRYITDRKGVVSGVLLVTANKIFFDPYKSHPLVLEHGWEEYLLSCSVDSLVSVSFCPDISHVRFSAPTQRPKSRRKEAHLKMSRSLGKRQQGDRRGPASEQKEEMLLARASSAAQSISSASDMTCEPAPDGQGLGDKEQESHDMAEAKKQLGGTADELAVQCSGMLGTAVLSSAATFCCGGLDAGDIGDTEQGSTKQCTRKGTSGSKACGGHGDLMFVRLRFHPTQRKKRNLGPSRAPTMKDAWFTLSQESSDDLYAYLTHWRPDVCILEGGQEEEEEDEEFVLVDSREPEACQSEARAGDEWEMVCVDEGGGRTSSLTLDREPEGLADIVRQSVILGEHQVREMYSRLPPRTVGHAWQLAYSTWRHGASLRSLYRRLAGSDSPALLLIKDSQSQVFGAFLSHPLRPSETFYGTGETFLFTMQPSFQCFRWTGANSFFIKGDLDSFAVGGGSGHFGLWLDETLYRGRSSPCDTFNNRCLSETDDFRVLELEVWNFC